MVRKDADGNVTFVRATYEKVGFVDVKQCKVRWGRFGFDRLSNCIRKSVGVSLGEEGVRCSRAVQVYECANSKQ